MKRQELLEAASRAVRERADQHGQPEDVFEGIALLWSVYLCKELTATDVALMMVLFKVARAQGNPENTDTWADIAGYAACGAELATEKEDGDGRQQ